MKIAILLYDDMTTLDAIGPYETLAHLPGNEVQFVAKEPGVVRVDTGFLRLEARQSIREVTSADVVIVPGGPGSTPLESDGVVLEWLRSIHETTRFTTSVCTGSLVLGAAGLLNGLRATSHWRRLERLSEFGAIPTSDRVVIEGKIITAAGVSAGIDMGLHMVSTMMGPEVAQAVQLGIEYDPEPPFDAGSPEKAPAPIVEMVKGLEWSR